MKFGFKKFNHYSYFSYIHYFLMLTLTNCITAEKSCTTNNRFELFNCTLDTVPLVLIDCKIFIPNNCLLENHMCSMLTLLINGGNNGQKMLKKMNTNLLGQYVQDRSVSPWEATPCCADQQLSQRHCKFVACRKKVRINLIILHSDRKLVYGDTVCPQFFKMLFGSQSAILVIIRTYSRYRLIRYRNVKFVNMGPQTFKMLSGFQHANLFIIKNSPRYRSVRYRDVNSDNNACQFNNRASHGCGGVRYPTLGYGSLNVGISRGTELLQGGRYSNIDDLQWSTYHSSFFNIGNKNVSLLFLRSYFLPNYTCHINNMDSRGHREVRYGIMRYGTLDVGTCSTFLRITNNKSNNNLCKFHRSLFHYNPSTYKTGNIYGTGTTPKKILGYEPSKIINKKADTYGNKLRIKLSDYPFKFSTIVRACNKNNNMQTFLINLTKKNLKKISKKPDKFHL